MKLRLLPTVLGGLTLALAALGLWLFWSTPLPQSPGAALAPEATPGKTGASAGSEPPPAPRDQTPKAPPAAAMPELPEKVKQYLAGSNILLLPTEIPTLDKATLEHLLPRFEACDEPRTASRLAHVLSRTVDERVVSAFKHKLTNGFAGRQLTNEEVFDVAGIAGSMYWLAGQLDSAYAFIKQGTTLAFWRTNRQWTALELKDGDSVPHIFASRCWICLGESQRPGTYEYLLEFREGRRTLENPGLAGSVVDAAFRYCENEKIWAQGPSVFMRLMDIFDDWLYRTEEGQKWDAWFLAVLGLNTPSTPPPPKQAPSR